MREALKISAVQRTPTFNEVNGNMRRGLSFIKEAAPKSAGLIVFPELLFRRLQGGNYSY